MSVKNDGRLAQDEFEAYWETWGKAAYLHRITDAAEVFGMNKRMANVKKQPADYVLVHGSFCGYAEVKSTDNVRGFRLSMISAYQLGTMQRVVEAGGGYHVFVRRLGVKAAWYRIPAAAIIHELGRSFSWEWLDQYYRVRDMDPAPAPLPVKKKRATSILNAGT